MVVLYVLNMQMVCVIVQLILLNTAFLSFIHVDVFHLFFTSCLSVCYSDRAPRTRALKVTSLHALEP